MSIGAVVQDIESGACDGYCGDWEDRLRPAVIEEVDDETALLRISIYLAGLTRREEDKMRRAGTLYSIRLDALRSLVEMVSELPK